MGTSHESAASFSPTERPMRWHFAARLPPVHLPSTAKKFVALAIDRVAIAVGVAGKSSAGVWLTGLETGAKVLSDAISFELFRREILLALLSYSYVSLNCVRA